MKTTVHIPDALLADAQALAAREGTTLKALVQEGLRRVIAEHQRKPRFELRQASFGGDGLNPDLAQAPWERIRDLAYEGHGG